MRKGLLVGACVLGLLGLFVGLSRLLPPALQPVPATATPVTTADFTGSWQCPRPTLELGIQTDGQALQVTGLADSSLRFESAGPASYRESGGHSLSYRPQGLFLRFPSGEEARLERRQ